MKRLIFTLLSCLAAVSHALPPHPVKASLISETKGYSPGKTLTVGLLLKTETHWHTYWRDPGDAGLPTSIEFKLPSGLKASDIQWPKPRVFKDPGGLIGYGYEGDNHVKSKREGGGENFRYQTKDDAGTASPIT